MSDDTVKREPGLPTIDVNEYGGKRDGVRQEMNRRLFMQVLVFDVDARPDHEAKELASRLGGAGVRAVVYADAMDPSGIGVLTWSEDPAHFVQKVRPHLQSGALQLRRDYAMLGVGSSRVDLQACKLEYSIVSPK